MPAPRIPEPGARAMAVALVLAMLPLQTKAADLVVNGGFDSDISSWEVDGSPTPIWAPLDAYGAPASGSGVGFNSSAQAGERIVVLRQCVDNLEPGRYFIAGAGYVVSGQAVGKAGISVTTFVGPGCTGGAQLLAGAFIDGTNTWQRKTFKGFAGSTGNGTLGSVWLRLFIDKVAAGGTMSGNFDDFAVDRILLEEGFEDL